MFLGVDGGGTKTGFCLIDRQGAVLSMSEAGSCYYFNTGVEEMERTLTQGVQDICTQAGIGVDAIEYAFFGLPTYGESSRDVAMLDEVPARILTHRRYQCDNDMVCGWAGSLGAKDGINVIAGTGSMTYGEHAGRKVRCGGWGELFGDEGSAYWIAIQGLACFTRMSDGRLPKGLLHFELSTHLQLSDDLDLVDVVLNQWKGDRAKIATLCRSIVSAAERGDAHAVAILHQAANELAELVDVTRQRLEFDIDDDVAVSYSGGVFNAGPVLLHAFEKQLSRLHAGYSLRQPLFSPALGAAIYAAKLNETPIDVALVRTR